LPTDALNGGGNRQVDTMDGDVLAPVQIKEVNLMVEEYF
jgi:hypothetical protein